MKIPEEGNSYPLQYSCLENSMDRGAWQAPVHGVAKNQTWIYTYLFTGVSQVVLVVKILPANTRDVRDMGLIPGSIRSPGEGNGYPPQYSCLENSMDHGAWWATVHGLQRVRHDRATNTTTTICICIGLAKVCLSFSILPDIKNPKDFFGQSSMYMELP